MNGCIRPEPRAHGRPHCCPRSGCWKTLCSLNTNVQWAAGNRPASPSSITAGTACFLPRIGISSFDELLQLLHSIPPQWSRHPTTLPPVSRRHPSLSGVFIGDALVIIIHPKLEATAGTYFIRTAAGRGTRRLTQGRIAAYRTDVHGRSKR